jgi:hypothetical protein
MLHDKVDHVINKKFPFFILYDSDSIQKVKEIFASSSFVLDSNCNKYDSIGDFFLLLKGKNNFAILRCISDSIWNYNQHYTIKFNSNIIDNLYKVLNVRGVDCFTSDSTKFIK